MHEREFISSGNEDEVKEGWGHRLKISQYVIGCDDIIFRLNIQSHSILIFPLIVRQLGKANLTVF